MPERVWEQSLTSDLADAGVRYTLLDDFHFKNAGLGEDELHGYYITEDDGQAARRVPGQRAAAVPDSVPRAGGDDRLPARRSPSSSRARSSSSATTARSSAVWPGTKEHVYDNGWLRRFFDALVGQPRAGCSVVTPTEALDQVPPLGKVYIPEGSYREMTEWALPDRAARRIRAVCKHRLEHEGRWHEVAPFVRGGYWRNFKVKYPETNEMYARMQMVSRRLQELDAPHASNGTERRAYGPVA